MGGVSARPLGGSGSSVEVLFEDEGSVAMVFWGHISVEAAQERM